MDSDARLTCIEGSEQNAQVIAEVIRMAFGRKSPLLEKIKVINSLTTTHIRSSSNLSTLLQQPHEPTSTSTSPPKVDFIFLDHDKDCYLPDLKELEKADFIDRVTVVADNVIFPGAPAFLEYVRYSAGSGGGVEKATPKAGGGVGVGEGEEKEKRKGEWETYLQPFAFERVGFETQFKAVPDAMSVSVIRR